MTDAFMGLAFAIVAAVVVGTGATIFVDGNTARKLSIGAFLAFIAFIGVVIFCRIFWFGTW